MEAVRQYVVSVTTAAIFCGVVSTLLRKGPSHSLVKLLCGTFLAFTFLKPIPELSLESLSEPFLPDLEAGRDVTQEGERMARDALAQIITQRIETYILEKADVLGVSVGVEVILSEDSMPVPTGVIVSGSVSPYAKKQLQQFIRQQLGIAEEDQQWIG